MKLRGKGLFIPIGRISRRSTLRGASPFPQVKAPRRRKRVNEIFSLVKYTGSNKGKQICTNLLFLMGGMGHHRFAYPLHRKKHRRITINQRLNNRFRASNVYVPPRGPESAPVQSARARAHLLTGPAAARTHPSAQTLGLICAHKREKKTG